MTLPDDTKPSAESVAHDLALRFCGQYERGKQEIKLALDRFRAAGVREERPAEKIANGLRGAIHTTKLAGEIIDLLPPGVATRDLFHQIIAILAPHISEPPHDR